MSLVAVPGWLVASAATPVAIAGFVYAVRKVREYQWGWIRNRYSLDDRVYIVTGANTGLGFETALALAKRGATVIMACRSEQRANEAIAAIRRRTSDGILVFMQLDLAEAASVRSFVRQLLVVRPHFDCVIANAGLAITTSQTNCAGLELTFATNHLGHFLLTQLLTPAIRTNGARIVVVSSGMHTRGRLDFARLGAPAPPASDAPDAPAAKRGGDRNAAYSASKLANFYMARELYRRGFDVHVLCPGLCHTDFFRHYEPRWYHYVLFAPVVWLALRSAWQGAQNIVWCATDSVNTDAENPATGYYVRSLRQQKSKYAFSDEEGERLWLESERMCAEALTDGGGGGAVGGGVNE